MEKLAILGGTPAVRDVPEDLFRWPIMTDEDYEAAMDVVKNNKFSGTDITEQFQEEFARWLGAKYAIAYCNGTMAITSAMFAIGLGAGDEIICPTKTYWGSVSQAINFGASAVFCNIDETLCLDPTDLERCITPRTKAIVAVHYFAHPCDMDPIMEIARRHHLYVIEDVSHAQGGLYKGRRLGTIGDVGAMSLMSGKSFAAGELGALVTNDDRIYERAMAFGHYERNNEKYIRTCDDLKPYYHIALGGAKGRANQLCSALARVQLKYYDQRCAEIRRAMNAFWDKLEGLPGVKGIRVDESTGSNMAGWYQPHAIYRAGELHGLKVSRFCEALRAEAPYCGWEGGNFCLHTHPFFKTFELRHEGKPSRIACNDRDVRQDDELCRRSEEIDCFSAPWFKHYDPVWIDRYAAAFQKVVENHGQLLEREAKAGPSGRWYGTENA